MKIDETIFNDNKINIFISGGGKSSWIKHSNRIIQSSAATSKLSSRNNSSKISHASNIIFHVIETLSSY